MKKFKKMIKKIDKLFLYNLKKVLIMKLKLIKN